MMTLLSISFSISTRVLFGLSDILKLILKIIKWPTKSYINMEPEKGSYKIELLIRRSRVGSFRLIFFLYDSDCLYLLFKITLGLMHWVLLLFSEVNTRFILAGSNFFFNNTNEIPNIFKLIFNISHVRVIVKIVTHIGVDWIDIVWISRRIFYRIYLGCGSFILIFGGCGAVQMLSIVFVVFRVEVEESIWIIHIKQCAQNLVGVESIKLVP